MRIIWIKLFPAKAFLTFLIILFPVVVLPQESVTTEALSTCAENLQNAQVVFDKGQVQDVPAILESCMKSGFTREEQLSAYKLLIQSYLFEDKLDKADSTMLEFLRKNPEYELSPTDHSSFVYLYNKFIVKPIVQVTLHLGSNLPFVSFVKQNHASGIQLESDYSSTVLNLYGSLETKFKISEKLEINFEAGYSQIKFTNIEEFPNLEDTVFKRTTYNETQNRIELPLSLTYNFRNFGPLTPYCRLGLGPAFTFGARATAESKSVAIMGGGKPVSGAEVSRIKSRISMDLLIQTGAGLKLKTRGGFINAELRLNPGLLNQVIEGKDPVTVEDLACNYSYVDDDFHLNTLNFTFGYTFILYKASKRRE